MPAGPKGQKRPADVIGNAVKVMCIATAGDCSEGRFKLRRYPQGNQPFLIITCRTARVGFNKFDDLEPVSKGKVLLREE